MFKFRQMQFATWKNTFNKIKNTQFFSFFSDRDTAKRRAKTFHNV